MVMRFTALALLICTISVSAQPGDTRRINPIYKNKANPFLEVLGMGHMLISTVRDSTRVTLVDGGYVDLIMDRRRLWRFSQFDRDDVAMDAGDLEGGTGHVRFVNGGHAYEAEFVDGTLNGEASHGEERGGHWVKISFAQFKDGLLHGEVRYQSIWHPAYLAVLERYEHGVIQLRESYGRRNWLKGFLLFLVKPVRNVGEVCSRTVYVDGEPRVRQCLLNKKCRHCGV